MSGCARSDMRRERTLSWREKLANRDCLYTLGRTCSASCSGLSTMMWSPFASQRIIWWFSGRSSKLGRYGELASARWSAESDERVELCEKRRLRLRLGLGLARAVLRAVSVVSPRAVVILRGVLLRRQRLRLVVVERALLAVERAWVADWALSRLEGRVDVGHDSQRRAGAGT